MRLRRLTAWFGVLAGQITFSPDHLNLVLDGNERGKSTLLAAILAALYGFPTARGRTPGGLPRDRDRYRPLHGNRFEVTLELEADGHGYEVYRDFARDTVTVRDALTGADITHRFMTGQDRCEVGQVLMGLTREQFLKTAFVRQGAVGELRQPTDLTSRLEAVVSTYEGEHTAAEALAALQQALDAYEGITVKGPAKVDTEIARLEDRLADLKRQLADLDEQRRQVDRDLACLEQLEQQARDLEEERERARYLGALAAMQECRDALRRHGEALDELERLRQQAEGLRHAADVRPNDYHELLQLQEKIRHARRELDRVEDRLLESDERRTETESRLRAYTGFEGVTPTDLDTAVAIRRSLLEATERRTRARRDLERAREAVARDGLDVARASGLAKRFTGLSATDREFLASYSAVQLRLQRVVDQLTQVMGSKEGSPQKSAWPVAALAVAMMVAGAILAVLLSALPGVTLFLIGGSLLAYQLAARAGGGGSASAEQQAVLLAKQRDLMEAEQRLREHKERGAALARSLGYDDADALVDDYAAYLKEGPQLEQLRQMEDALRAAEEEVAARQDDGAALWRRIGRDLPPAHVDLESLDDFIAQLRAYLKLLEEHRSWQQQVEEIAQEREHRRRELRAAEEEAAAIAARYGLAADLDQAASQLARLVSDREALDRLISERIPAVEARLLSEERLATVQRQEQELQTQLEAMRAQCPTLATLPAVHPSSTYYAQVNETQRQLDEVYRQREQLLRSAAALDQQRNRYAELLTQQAEWEIALDRARDFRDAVALARDTLERIAEESHRDWARVLNAEAARLLPILSGRYVSMRFDRDLSFVVQDREGRVWDQRAVESQLSAGARDQIYLTLRIILARCFSHQAAAIPLILDDPFVTTDDARFLSAMRFLSEELAPAHQIIVTSCHEVRYHNLILNAAPDLADRIQVIAMDGVVVDR